MGRRDRPKREKKRKKQQPNRGKKGNRGKQKEASLPVCGGRFRVPWNVYHGIPVGWTKDDMVSAHRQMRGTYLIDSSFSMASGIREPTQEQLAWFDYRRTLYKIADGVRVGDRACIELAIRYIELRFIGSYSGFIRALLARRLKHVDLDTMMQERLIRHFEMIEANRDYTAEFRDYEKLWKCIATAKRGLQ